MPERERDMQISVTLEACLCLTHALSGDCKAQGGKDKMHPPPSRTCKLYEIIAIFKFSHFLYKRRGENSVSLPILIQGFKPKKYLILLLWLRLKLTAAPRASGSFWIFISLSGSWFIIYELL